MRLCPPTQHSTRPAFTLAELLVVILILGALAAVAVPQFGSASQDAKLAALDADLACVRKAIERYRLDHDGTCPGAALSHKESEVAVIRAHIDTREAFSKQLGRYSNARGDTSDKKNPAYPFGPYLRRALPPNPLPAPGAAAAAVRVVHLGAPLSADAAPKTGWKTDSQTGEFIANHAPYDRR